MRRKKNPAIDPEPGIWYFLWLKPNWMLFTDFGSDASHLQYWLRHAVPTLAKHYKLSLEQIDACRSLTYSMPRGRVAIDEYGAYVGHGNDSPSSLASDVVEKDIVNVFALGSYSVRGKLSIRVDRHEKMSPSQKKKIQKVLGKIPY